MERRAETAGPEVSDGEERAGADLDRQLEGLGAQRRREIDEEESDALVRLAREGRRTLGKKRRAHAEIEKAPIAEADRHSDPRRERGDGAEVRDESRTDTRAPCFFIARGAWATT